MRAVVTQSLVTFGLIVGAATGCGPVGEAPEASEAAILGVAPGQDAADTGCHVVLRRAGREPGPGGFASECVDGACWFVWTGSLDLSDAAVAAGAEPGVLYGGASGWHEVAATPVSGAPAGFQRYAFRFSRDTASPGMSLTSLMRYRLELVPFLRGPDGARLFDHNRNPDPLANYVLDRDSDWSVAEDAAVCPAAAPPVETPVATLQFSGGWSMRQHGSLVRGGRVRIEYEPLRLPDCRARYAGRAAWNIQGFVQVWPSGAILSGPLVAHDYDAMVSSPAPLELALPEDAERVELWFQAGDRAGCVRWDSNYGQNYRFEVRRDRPPAPTWAGDWGQSLNRACERRPGGDLVTLTDYSLERGCNFVEADVYVPGLTDGPVTDLGLVAAQVQLLDDAGSSSFAWLAPVGRVGNNYRYRWMLPNHALRQDGWSQYRFWFRFSTDGVRWWTAGRDDGNGGAPRTIVRAPRAGP